MTPKPEPIEGVCVICGCDYIQWGRERESHWYTACPSCREIEREKKEKNKPWWAGFVEQ